MQPNTVDPLRTEYIKALEAENDQLRERVIQLEDELKNGRIILTLPLEWELTGKEYALAEALMRLPVASKEQLLTALYGHLPNSDEPEIKIIDVFVCKARKKLKKFDIDIDTVWGRGYMFSAAMKDKIRDVMKRKGQQEVTEYD